MIKVLIGGQGSGKTLTSIHFLFELIETENGKVPRHSLYKRLITNVGGFKPFLFKEISGNHDIEIKHFDKHLVKEDLLILFDEQMKEREKPQNERIPTLFIYDECQFALSTFSISQANLETCEYISNFFSLQRHYGPCDFLLMTQSLDKVHPKYLGTDFELYISPEYSHKSDPENDIVFDLYDSEGRNIITGGRDKIKYKKHKLIKTVDGNDFNPFMLYVSGDGGRKIDVKKSYWKKYLYIFIFLIFFALCCGVYVVYSLFFGFDTSVKHVEQNNTKESNTTTVPTPQSVDDFIDLSLPPPNSVKGAKGNLSNDENSTYNQYVKEPYENINAQLMHRVFVMDNIYYVGNQLLRLDEFKALVDKQVFFVVSIQPVTKKSFYINLLIHQSVLNSFGLVKNNDDSNDKRLKSSLKSKE